MQNCKMPSFISKSGSYSFIICFQLDSIYLSPDLKFKGNGQGAFLQFINYKFLCSASSF